MNKAKTFLITALTIMLSGAFSFSGNATIAAASLDTTKHGYGQGKAVDENNCPYGAIDFNSQYEQFNAYALTDDSNSIILTFDQGYENGYTIPILDTLKEKNVKAIFFLTGDYAVKETKLVQRMIDEGHILGNHCMTHASMPDLSVDECKAEIMDLHEYVLEKYGYDMQYLRPPCGEFSEVSLATAQDLGYKTLMWSYAYVDWKVDNQPSVSQALEKLNGAAHGGGIYLLHSVSKTNSEVLGEVIDSMRAKGYNL